MTRGRQNLRLKRECTNGRRTGLTRTQLHVIERQEMAPMRSKRTTKEEHEQPGTAGGQPAATRRENEPVNAGGLRWPLGCARGRGGVRQRAESLQQGRGGGEKRDGCPGAGGAALAGGEGAGGRGRRGGSTGWTSPGLTIALNDREGCRSQAKPDDAMDTKTNGRTKIEAGSRRVPGCSRWGRQRSPNRGARETVGWCHGQRPSRHFDADAILYTQIALVHLLAGQVCRFLTNS